QIEFLLEAPLGKLLFDLRPIPAEQDHDADLVAIQEVHPGESLLASSSKKQRIYFPFNRQPDILSQLDRMLIIIQIEMEGVAGLVIIFDLGKDERPRKLAAMFDVIEHFLGKVMQY